MTGLDDLCVRFIINLPQEDLSSVARICFQVEEAQWFYEDFIRPLDPSLPSMTLRTFCLRIFQHCPLLASFSVENHIKAFEEFLQYKTRVPVRGAILLNHAMDSVVLVKGWKKGANWSFPRGKINKDEDDLDCAVREVYEETGLDLQAAGLVPTEAKPKYIEIAMREQQLRLYVFRDVPMETNFHPRTRKEISKIQWYKLTELPTLRKKNLPNNQYDSGPGNSANKFYMVAPFLVPLKKWVMAQKKLDEKKTIGGLQPSYSNQYLSVEEYQTEDDGWASSATAKVPAIETLDGATRELQRLLKMQPPTQGIQPPPVAVTQEDKGSALLSLLQPLNAAPTTQPAPQADNHLQYTSIHHPPGTEIGQVRDLHHHSDNLHHVPSGMHQPSTSFPLPVNQMAAGWNSSQNQGPPHGPQPPAPGYGYAGYPVHPGYSVHPNIPHQQYPTLPVQAIHHQALPPQVQRAASNQNTFERATPQETEAARATRNFQSGLSQPQPVYDQLDSNQQHQYQSHQQIQHPGHPQAHQPAANPKPLNGQSMALLNAFKREPEVAPPTELKTGGENQHSTTAHQSGGQYMPSPVQSLAPVGLPNLLSGSLGRTVGERSPVVANTAPAAQHRSSLLDMFKKVELGTVVNQVSSPLGGQGASIHELAASSQPETHSVAHLQNPTRTKEGPFQPQAGEPVHTKSNVQAGGQPLGKITIQQRPKQKTSRAEGKSAHRAPAASQPSKPIPVQPTRILQRGQTLDSPSLSDQIAQSPKSLDFSMYAPQGHQRPSQRGDSPVVLPAGTSPDQSKRPEGSKEQKRQLLSLFGSSPVSSAGGMMRQLSQGGSTASGMARQLSQSGSAAGDAPRSRMASLASASVEGSAGYRNASPLSRAGNATPISQADQSFLLGYLQSVTNNAGR